MRSLRGDYGELDWIDTVGNVLENLSSDRNPPLNSVKADSENVRCTEPAMWVDRAVPLGGMIFFEIGSVDGSR